MTKRNIAVYIQAVLAVAPPLGMIFPWLQVIVPTAFCFVVPADGPPFSEAYLPLVGVLSVTFGFIALTVFSLTKSQSTLLLRIFVWAHVIYSGLAILVWLVFFGSRTIINFPIKDIGFYLLFFFSLLPHVLWILLLRWCLRQLRPLASGDAGHGRQPGYLAFPALIALSVVVAGAYKPPEPHYPMREAVRSGDRAAVDSLLRDNPQIVAEESYRNPSETPLHVAIGNNDSAMVELLIEAGADLNPAYGSPLFKAISTGKPEMVQLLIERGSNPNPPDPGFYTPLMEAIRCNDAAMLTLLLEKGADVNASLSIGRGGTGAIIERTVLKVAAEDSKYDLVEILLASGADVNHKGPNDDAAINMACRSYSGAEKICATLKVLLEAGADINEKGYDGMTPLHLAARGRYINKLRGQQKGGWEATDTTVVGFLLENGSDISLSDDNGMTALDYAERNGHTEIARLIRDVGSKQTAGE